MVARSRDEVPAEVGNPVTRSRWRLQIQGPNTWAVIEKLNGAALPYSRVARETSHAGWRTGQ